MQERTSQLTPHPSHRTHQPIVYTTTMGIFSRWSERSAAKQGEWHLYFHRPPPCTCIVPSPSSLGGDDSNHPPAAVLTPQLPRRQRRTSARPSRRLTPESKRRQLRIASSRWRRLPTTSRVKTMPRPTSSSRGPSLVSSVIGEGCCCRCFGCHRGVHCCHIAETSCS